MTVLKSWIATKDISRWNQDTETEIRLHRKETVKQFSFLKYQKLTQRNIKTTTIFFIFQKNIKRSTSELRQFPTHQNYIEKYIEVTSIIALSQLHQKSTSKWRGNSLKSMYRRNFDIDWTCCVCVSTMKYSYLFNVNMKINTSQALWHQNKNAFRVNPKSLLFIVKFWCLI